MYGLCRLCPNYTAAHGCAYPAKGDFPARVLGMEHHELDANQLLNTVADSNQIAFIREGWAFSFRTSETGERVVGGLYTKGHVLGFPLVFASDFHYSARALSKLKLCTVSVESFMEQVRLQDSYFEYFQRESLRLVWMLSNRVYDMSHRSVEERLCRAFVLVSLTAYGEIRNYKEPVPVTQEILADLVGTSKVHINRILVKLKKEHICHASHGFMYVYDRDKLMRRAGVSASELQEWQRVVGFKKDPLALMAN